MKRAVQAVDDRSFRFPQSLLIGNLENAAIGIRTLAEQAAYGYPQLIHRIDNLVHVLGHHQTREMHHRRSPHPCSKVSRASSQKSQFTVIGIADGRFDACIQGIGDFPNASEIQTGTQHLNSQMILLVDHDATIPIF